MLYPHRVLSRTIIMDWVWDSSFEGLTNIVDVYVRQVRRKIDEGFEPKLIRTVRGIGYAVDPMGELLWQRGLYRGDRPGQGSGLRTIEAPAFFDAVSEVILDGRAEGLLYRIERNDP